MLRNRLLGSVAMATGLLMAMPTYAQQNDGVTLRPIVVTPVRPAATTAPQTDQLDTPLSATTIHRDELKPEAAASSDTASVLGNIPGVNVYSAGGVSGLPVIDGFADDRLNILIDGASISSACANHMNPPLSYIAPLNIGKVEVLSGITPVSKGGDSIGGTIIVDRQAPQFAATRAPS
jgi:Outer membrane receptor for ferrienterochelin and colicins